MQSLGSFPEDTLFEPIPRAESISESLGSQALLRHIETTMGARRHAGQARPEAKEGTEEGK